MPSCGMHSREANGTAMARSLLQECQLPCQGSLWIATRPESALLRPLEARFLPFRVLPTADSVDLASHRTFATGY